MKKTRFLFLGLISLVLLTSCEKKDNLKPVKFTDATKVVKAPLIHMEEWPEGENCSLQTFDLIAGKHIYAGSVEAVIADLEGISTLFVKYKTFGDCKLTEAHLFVGAPDAVIPATKKGNPKIGHFPFFWDEMGSENEVVFTIALADIGMGEEDCFKIAAHAVVVCDGVEETAWARGSDLVFALKCYPEGSRIEGAETPKAITGQEVPPPWENRLIYYPLAQALVEEIPLVSHWDGATPMGTAIVEPAPGDGYQLVITLNDAELMIEETALYVGPASGFYIYDWDDWTAFIPVSPVNPQIIPLDVSMILSGHEFEGSRWGWYVDYCPAPAICPEP